LKYGSGSSRRVTRVSLEVIAALQRHHWPGNVRELENVIHSAVVRSETDTVAIEDLPEDLLLTPASPHRSGVGNYYAIMEQTARQLVVTALAATGGSESRAAQLIGLHPKSIYRLRRRLGL
jgi:DNA-binding NtrC family response regulator